MLAQEKVTKEKGLLAKPPLRVRWWRRDFSNGHPCPFEKRRASCAPPFGSTVDRRVRRNGFQCRGNSNSNSNSNGNGNFFNLNLRRDFYCGAASASVIAAKIAEGAAASTWRLAMMDRASASLPKRDDFRRLSTEETAMKGWAAKGAAFVVFVGTMAMTAPVAAEPTYACTAETEGHMFLVPYDHPSDPGYYYQCRGGAWRLVGICTPGGGCPPEPDPNGPIVEM